MSEGAGGRRFPLPRWAWALVGLAALIGAFAEAPRLLRRMDAFRVERVEVVGVRYLAPDAVIETAGIAEGSSIFDDPSPWRDALLAHPMVADVRFGRRLPGTLVVEVVEVDPVALARTPELAAVDAAARILPVEPGRGELDLPVLAVRADVGADGRLSDAAAALVESYLRIRSQDAAIAARISELGPGLEEGGVRLILREPSGCEVLLAAGADALRLAQLRLTLADLEAKAEAERVRRIDLRFRDQVVVSLDPGSRS